MNLTHWVRQNGLPLATLDPAAPLDDLEPLRSIIGSARVVGIGECAHHVREFYLLRHRLLRFLVERCGFTAYAFEAPYVGARPINSWVHGGGGDLAELSRAPAMFLSACED